MGLTRIPNLTKLRFTAPAVLSDRYRNSVIKHLRLGNLDDRLEHFVAFSHWHPKVLELLDESKEVGTNMNVQMTPSFLSGRDQFTYSELSADMVKCKLRYISETNFARVTDENLLTDVIPASVLPYIKDCISWGHASANLCKKYKDRDYV